MSLDSSGTPDPEEIKHLEKLLDICRVNLDRLLGQAIQHGSEALAPQFVGNSLRETRKQIADLKAELRRLGQEVPGHFGEDVGAEQDRVDRPVSPLDVSDHILPMRRQIVERKEIAEIENQLRDPNEHRIVVLYGRSGLGKTTVSKAIAHNFHDAREAGQPVPFDRILQYEYRLPGSVKPTLEEYLDDLAGRLGIGKRDDRREQQDLVRTALKQKRYLLIVDDVPDTIVPDVFDFIGSVSQIARVLVTQQSTPPDTNCCIIQMSELSDDQVRTFLELYCPDESFDDDHVAQIAKATKRNTSALVEITKIIATDKLTKTIEHLDEHTMRPGREPAEVLIGRALERLDDMSRALLSAHVVFKNTAHEQALIFMVSQHFRGQARPSALRQLIRQLVADRVLDETSEHGRYRMDNHYHSYLDQLLQDNQELDKWQQHWVAYYCQLRERRSELHDRLDDEIGWTIYTDYIRNEQVAVNYTHRDEVAAIVDAIKYCLAPSRRQRYWRNAAQLLDDFRATLFAAGYWKDRKTFCLEVIKLAQRASDLHTVGQFKRLVAWICCFQDQYQEGRQYAEEAYRLACENLVRPPGNQSQAARIVHSQTYYKALNTLGQLSLREGRAYANHGLHALRGVKKTQRRKLAQANRYFEQARDCFANARSYFTNARRYVEVVFEPEVLIIAFHQAEVEFYDRHSAVLLTHEDEREKWALERLEVAKGKLDTILKDAYDRHVDGMLQRHQRLIAHTNYYLGKIERRLARAIRNPDEQSKAFKRAEDYLKEAMRLARYFEDRVLLARIELAFGQWYESQIDRERNGKEDQYFLEQARQYVSSADKALENWGAELEHEDVTTFFEQRLQKDIMALSIGD